MRNGFKKNIREAIKTELNYGFYDGLFSEIEKLLEDTLNEIEAEFEKEKKEKVIDRKFKREMSVAIHGEFHAGFDASEYMDIEKRLVENLHNIANEWLIKKSEL